MKPGYLLSFIVLLLLPFASRADQVDNAAALIKQGNTKELMKLFAPTVELTIMDNDDNYAPAQAAAAIDKFFAVNKPKSIKLLHKINSSASFHMGVYILTTDKGLFRVAITLKDAGSSMNIIELRIEDEKVK